MHFSKTDLLGALAALAVHVGIAYWLAYVRAAPEHRPSWVEMDVRKPVPPPPKNRG